MIIISEDSTEAWTRYLLAGSCGLSTVKWEAAPVIVPPQDRLPLISMLQPLRAKVSNTSAPAVLELLIAIMVALVPLLFSANKPFPSAAVPTKPALPDPPESPQ